MEGTSVATPVRERAAGAGEAGGSSPRTEVEHRQRYSLAGGLGALVFGCASFTPSLAPRDWLWQGVVYGLSAAAGYAIGTALGWLVHVVTGWAPPERLARRLWVALAVAGVPLLAWALWLGHGWQRETHRLTGAGPPESYAWVRILLVGVVLFASLLGIARGLRFLVRRLSLRLIPLVPEWLAGPLAFLIVVLLLVGLNNGLIWRGLVAAANTGFGAVNGLTNTGTFRSMAPERSGSPASLISWESLGREGRNFVGQGPTLADLEAFSGEPAQRPVRVYAGLKSADTLEQRAALAVEDLRRAGGFDRAVLVVATTTGTGHIDPAAVETLEYMYNGDSAFVGLQYSYLPSWISFLADQEEAQQAGRVLFNRVYAAWSELPKDSRPELFVTGTSLGVAGSEAAFSGEADLLRRTDGVVWAGPPRFSVLHRRFVEGRDPGSPEWHPVYDEGRRVRFVSNADAAGRPTPARPPEVVYLQNGSDPVVLWTPRLLFDKPDWLSGPRAPDVSPDMFWIPVVTFWQVSADLPSNYDLPPGHGHGYLELYVDGWALVARPDGWSEQDSRRLRVVLRLNRAQREALLNAGR